MKTQTVLLTTTILLAGCSSVSKVIPTTKVVEVQTPLATTQSANFKTSASPEQIAIVCDTEDMRARIVDYDKTNDMVRLMVVQDSTSGSSLLSEVEIDCRDYHLRKSLAQKTPTLIQSSTETTEVKKTLRRSTQLDDSRFTYIVQRGDTVWQIAREHCTTVKAISRLNGLGRGNVIDIGQRLKMPDEDCG